MNQKEIRLVDWLQHTVTTNASATAVIEQSEKRIAKAYKEMLGGYDQDAKEILKIVEDVTAHDGLVVEKDIRYVSICGHHFLPFLGAIDIIYEPGTHIVGIGKLPRLAQMYARRFQLQEFMVKEIAQAIMEHLDAKGVYVRATGQHLCICGRGPNDRTAQTVTTYALGSLKDSQRTVEMMALLQ